MIYHNSWKHVHLAQARGHEHKGAAEEDSAAVGASSTKPSQAQGHLSDKAAEQQDKNDLLWSLITLPFDVLGLLSYPFNTNVIVWVHWYFCIVK